MFVLTPQQRQDLARSRNRLQRRRVGRKGWGFLIKVAVLTLLVGAVMTQVVLGTAGVRGPAVVVQPGQTLWGIASSHYPSSDPRAAIAAIESANHLENSQINPGERLLLPPI